MPTERAPVWRALLALVLATTLVKLAVVAAPRADLFLREGAVAGDAAGEADDEGAGEAGGGRRAVHGEEISRGNIAVELREGPILRLLDYQWATFFGGSLVIGILAIPYFELFGPSALALKLAPITFNALAVAFAFLALDRAAGRRAAWIGAGLLALAPPGYTVITTVAWGSHVELNALAMVAAWLLARLWTRPAGEGDRLDRFLLGALTGFGIWFGYGFLLVAASTVLADVLRDRRFPISRAALFQALGVAVGFLPWVVYNVRHDLAGLDVYGSPLQNRFTAMDGLLDLPARLARFSTDLVPDSLGFRALGPLAGRSLGLAVAAALAALAAFGVWRLRGELGRLLAGPFRRGPAAASPAALFALHAALFVVVFVVSRFWLDEDPDLILNYRYVMLFLPYLCALAGIGAAALWERGGGASRAAAAAAGLVLAANLAGAATLIEPEEAGSLAREVAFKREGHGRWLVLRYAEEPEVLRGWLERAPGRRSAEELEQYYDGIAQAVHTLTTPRGGARLRRRDRDRRDDYEELARWLREHGPEGLRSRLGP